MKFSSAFRASIFASCALLLLFVARSGCVPTRANQVAGVYQGNGHSWAVKLELRPNMTYTETVSHKGAPDRIFDVQKRWPASSNGIYKFDWCLSMEPSLRDGWTLVINPDTDSALTRRQ